MTMTNNTGAAAPSVAAAPSAAAAAPASASRFSPAQPSAPQPVASQRVRRVGSFSAGVALILSGALMCACLVWPRVGLWELFRFAPLLLVLLGGEILYANAKAAQAPLKYDIGAVLLCLLVIVCSLGATCVAAVAVYSGYVL